MRRGRETFGRARKRRLARASRQPRDRSQRGQSVHLAVHHTLEIIIVSDGLGEVTGRGLVLHFNFDDALAAKRTFS